MLSLASTYLHKASSQMKLIPANELLPRLTVLSTLLLLLLVNQARADEGCTSIDFARRPNLALKGRVFKKLEVDVQQCMYTCAKSVGCFSINTYLQNESGVQQCELLSSTLKASPQDVEIKPRYEYYELKGCELPNCLLADKEAFPDGSYRFKSSVYKLHPIRKTWSAAKDFCVSLSGNLASVNSETENTFLQETMAAHMHINTFSVSPWSSVLAQWKLDGSDSDVTLQPGATFKLFNGMTALYLDTSGYAEIPATDIQTISFTFALWVYPVTSGSWRSIFSEWSSPPVFMFERTPSQQLKFQMQNPSGAEIVNSGDFGSVPASQWTHIGVTWNRETTEATCYINGKLTLTKPAASGLDSIDVRSSSRSVYDLGLKRVSMNDKFYGYMRDLLIFGKALTEEEWALVPGSFDTTSGTWIGLNDVSSEGTFVWSDGSAKTHTEWTSGQPNDEFSIQDCTVMTKDGKWEDNRCDKELPFICETAA